MRYLPSHLEDPSRPGWLHPDELRRRRRSWQKCKARDDMYAQIHADPNACCALCTSRRYLVIDHIVPLARGGTNADCNLQILCDTCNARKGALL
jgi:5-methylcytosine-specific restriction endonuclease McrA